jgi:hypothetical protein
MDISGKFTGLHVLNPMSGSSGYYANNNKIFFDTGQFYGFDYQNGFDPIFGYSYTGFSFPEGSGFSGLNFSNSGYGIMTGNIGSRNAIIEIGSFSGFTGMPGFNVNVGFDYIVNEDTFQYNNINFISDIPNQITGNGIVTGNIGYKNYIIIDDNFGFGIMTGEIGYRNIFDKDPLIGYFYKKNQTGLKTTGPQFTLSTGESKKYIDLTYSIFQVNSNDRVGLDISKNLSGLKGLNISLQGFFN